MAQKKHRVILDTNVIISALCFKKSIPHKVYNAVGDKHVLLFSDETFLELEDVIFREKFRKYISLTETQGSLEYIREIGSFIDVTTRVNDIPDDPNDNAFLALSLDGRADYLVTGNVNHFMDAKIAIKYKDTVICNPKEFFEALV